MTYGKPPTCFKLSRPCVGRYSANIYIYINEWLYHNCAIVHINYIILKWLNFSFKKFLTIPISCILIVLLHLYVTSSH